MAGEVKLPHWFKEPRPGACPISKRLNKDGFVEKTLKNIDSFMKETVFLEKGDASTGILQSVDPRARIAGLFMLMASCAISTNAAFLLFAGLVAFALMKLSGVSAGELGKRVFIPVAFTFVLTLPVFFSLFDSGNEAIDIGGGILPVAITKEGLLTGFVFILRVTVMVSFSALILVTTTHNGLFGGLKGLKIPGFFITALFMTFRYIFILLKLLEDSALARKSRMISPTGFTEARTWFASRLSLLLARSLHTAEAVSGAMESRGFSGVVRTFKAEGLKPRDYVFIWASIFVFLVSVGLGV
ncbi:MAG: cobalt ECF transporter T component CbiQ [Deltaproteobacteria bacterium]